MNEGEVIIDNDTIIFPIEKETVAIARFSSDLINNLHISSAVPLRGWGIEQLNNIDYKGNIEGLQIKDIEDEFLEKNLILCKPYRYCDFEKDIVPFLEKNIDRLENVFFCWNEKRDYIKDLCKRNNTKYHEFKSDLDDINIGDNILYQVKTPVILVSSLAEMADKFYTEMSIYNFFKSKGYNTKLIGTKSYSGLFNVNTFPEFMFNNRYSNEEKIIKFNHYIKVLEKVSRINRVEKICYSQVDINLMCKKIVDNLINYGTYNII